VTSAQWIADARGEYAGLREAHERVAVVGLSMGGALAVQLAADQREIPALVLLSPYVTMPRLIQRAAMTSPLWGPAYPYFSSRGSRSIHDPVAAGQGLGTGWFTPAALRALHETAAAGNTALPEVASPTLMIQSREDNRISVADAKRTFASLGSHEKRLEWIAGAGHVISVDYGHETVFDLTAGWLAAHTRPRVTH